MPVCFHHLDGVIDGSRRTIRYFIAYLYVLKLGQDSIGARSSFWFFVFGGDYLEEMITGNLIDFGIGIPTAAMVAYLL